MIKVKYIFPGGTVPPSFYQDVFSPSWDCRHLMIEHSRNCNWGDDHEIVVSADTVDTIDYQLQTWECYRVKK